MIPYIKPEQREYFDTCPAIFVGQTKTKLVKGRIKFKVRNTYAPSFNNFPCSEKAYEEFSSTCSLYKERTELESLYFEFCKKAYNYLVGRGCFNGAHHPERIVFPDFTFEVIPQTIPIE